MEFEFGNLRLDYSAGSPAAGEWRLEGAEAFGLRCLAEETLKAVAPWPCLLTTADIGIQLLRTARAACRRSGSWMGASKARRLMRVRIRRSSRYTGPVRLNFQGRP